MVDLKTTAEPDRAVDGTEFVRLATAGANWKVKLSDMFAAMGSVPDPLILENGLYVVASNPPTDPTDSFAARIQLGTDSSQVDPVFSNVGTLEIINRAVNGQASNDARTSSKITFLTQSNSGYYNASGQKFLFNNQVQSFGMSDCGIYGNQFVSFAGGPVNGDEGQCWGSVSNLTQQQSLCPSQISAVPAQSTVSTTTTQAITRNKAPQTVTVVSAAGAVNGDWLVFEQEVESGSPNLEAVQIISFTPTSITGIFRHNHASGVTVTPALRLICTSTYMMGQDRFIINLTKPAYTTGTISTISGGGMNGAGTAWSNGMVGGNAMNIGAIALAADDYTDFPFDSGANRLKSWFKITQVTSASHLTIHSFSCAGATNYQGKGPGTGAYIIRQAAKVLRIIGDISGVVTGEIICETSTSTWSVGDLLEQPICPYADVSGFQWDMSMWTNGGSPRGFLNVRNTGARTFESCIAVGDWATIRGASADQIAWGTILAMGASANLGIDISQCVQAAIRLKSNVSGGTETDLGGMIKWDGAYIRMHSGNGGMTIAPGNGWDGVTPPPDPNVTAFTNLLQFIRPGVVTNTGDLTYQMNWGGPIFLPVCQNRTGSLIIEDNDANTSGGGPVNFSRFFQRWNTHVFEMGTEVGGLGRLTDFAIKTNNVERMRFAANGDITFLSGSVTPATLATNGQFTLTPTSNTNFRISYRGSDGTTRVGNITLV